MNHPSNVSVKGTNTFDLSDRNNMYMNVDNSLWDKFS